MFVELNRMIQEAGDKNCQSLRPGPCTAQHHFCYILVVRIVTESAQIQGVGRNRKKKKKKNKQTETNPLLSLGLKNLGHL